MHRYTISPLLADLLHCACQKARKLEFSEETLSSYALELGNNGIATVKRLSFIEKVFFVLVEELAFFNVLSDCLVLRIKKPRPAKEGTSFLHRL